jgi:hypothetical protein
MTPPIWFLVSGLLAMFASNRIRARQQLALPRLTTASAAPSAPLAVRRLA